MFLSNGKTTFPIFVMKNTYRKFNISWECDFTEVLQATVGQACTIVHSQCPSVQSEGKQKQETQVMVARKYASGDHTDKQKGAWKGKPGSLCGRVSY